MDKCKIYKIALYVSVPVAASAITAFYFKKNKPSRGKINVIVADDDSDDEIIMKPEIKNSSKNKQGPKIIMDDGEENGDLQG